MTLREQIARDEGLRLKPYTDTTGHLTLGYGRNLTAKGISLAEAELMLDNDLSEASAAVFSRLAWASALNEPRRAVLVGMAFNMGIAGLLGFRRMLAAAEAGTWDEAANEILSSDYAHQVGVRAERYSEQMRRGEWV